MLLKAELPPLPEGERGAAQTGCRVHTSRTDSSQHTTGKELVLRQTLHDQTHTNAHTETLLSPYMPPSTPGHVVRYTSTSKCGTKHSHRANETENANKCCWALLPQHRCTTCEQVSPAKEIQTSVSTNEHFLFPDKHRRLNPNSVGQQAAPQQCPNLNFKLCFPSLHTMAALIFLREAQQINRGWSVEGALGL